MERAQREYVEPLNRRCVRCGAGMRRHVTVPPHHTGVAVVDRCTECDYSDLIE